MWTIYKLWKTNEHTILKLWTLIKNIIERTHTFPYNILFTFLMDRGRAPNGIGHLMILLMVFIALLIVILASRLGKSQISPLCIHPLAHAHIKEDFKVPRFWSFVRGIHQWPMDFPSQSVDAAKSVIVLCRAGFRLAPSQWETSLQSNTVSHWPSGNLESALLW